MSTKIKTDKEYKTLLTELKYNVRSTQINVAKRRRIYLSPSGGGKGEVEYAH